MGRPVLHFEVIGSDGEALRKYYSDMFGWSFQVPPGPMDYGLVDREGNTDPSGVGIGGGVGSAPGSSGHVTFYVGVPNVEASLAQAESLGGKRVSGPDEVPGAGVVLGMFTDPEGHLIGLVQSDE
jgi:predicted enzyme related to lactoylglutathione lyase